MDEIIDEILSKTGSNLGKLEETFYRTVLDHFVDKLDIVEGSKILFNDRSKAAVNSLSSKLGNLNGFLLALGENIQNGVGKITEATLKDYAKYDTKEATLQNQVKKTINEKVNSSINSNLSLERPFAELKQRAMALLSRPEGITLSELRKVLKTEAFNKKIATRYFAAWTQDVYYQYQRSTSNEMRKKLGFRFAIYQGGTIETTRPFCEERNGKVYHEDEINDWDDLDFAGKLQVGHKCIIDCGGYRCRHRWGWVSDEVAFAMRPELEAKYGKKVEPKIEPKVDIEVKAYSGVKYLKEEFNFEDTRMLKLGKTGLSADEHASNLKRAFSSLGVNKVTYNSKLSKKGIDRKSAAVAALLKEYNFDGKGSRVEIEFSSGGSAFGEVWFNERLEITSINFGHRDSEARLFNRSQGSISSKVDKENSDLGTVVHEFLHVITNSTYSGRRGAKEDFFSDMAKLRAKYVNDLKTARENNDSDWFKINYLGNYANTNIDEFMAEAFAEYKLNSNPSPVALEVGKLIDKYYKK
jgi:hypothetical protein